MLWWSKAAGPSELPFAHVAVSVLQPHPTCAVHVMHGLVLAVGSIVDVHAWVSFLAVSISVDQDRRGKFSTGGGEGGEGGGGGNMAEPVLPPVGAPSRPVLPPPVASAASFNPVNASTSAIAPVADLYNEVSVEVVPVAAEPEPRRSNALSNRPSWADTVTCNGGRARSNVEILLMIVQIEEANFRSESSVSGVPLCPLNLDPK